MMTVLRTSVAGETVPMSLMIRWPRDARGLHHAGAEMIINGRTREKVDAAVTHLGSRARGHALDLASAEGCDSMIRAEPEPDIVVSNLDAACVAAISFFGGEAVWRPGPADWSAYHEFRRNILFDARGLNGYGSDRPDD
ncbi:hypothetical protein [Rhizobium sp. P28RR-XV]|uniref:hypothetical protein n=1 Tax=Rhizobium sp. P28RR-XV TaxID=2726737 RepID=UPI001FEDEF63|nr:hypothetical protein [Rhizobium sp. P28RR-XV]